MDEPVKRPYRSPLREEAARRTRARIRDAAARLFVRQGYAVTTMREIADEAEVSERTTYLVFPTKLDLLLEVIGVSTRGDDQPLPLAQRPEFQSALGERDGKRAIEQTVSFVAELLERAGPLVMAAYESIGADKALREPTLQGERARAQDLGLVAKALEAHGQLRDDLTADEATDILFSVLSPQTHQMFRVIRKRSAARYERTAVELLKRALLHE
jgi:AcrR family transcriptional regulator